METAETFARRINVPVARGIEQLVEIGMVDWKPKPGDVQFLYFSMVSLMINVRNVLELGTGIGGATTVLSKLCPKATVYTLDLPRSDGEYSKSWRAIKADRIAGFNTSIARSNVRFIEVNSFFLHMLNLPEKFELVWVDGGHMYPAVAWDIMYVYNHLEVGGFMFIHDYSPKCLDRTEVVPAVSSISGQIKEEIWILRLDPDPGPRHCMTACVRKLK